MPSITLAGLKYRSNGGGMPVVRKFPISSLALSMNELVTLDTNGTVVRGPLAGSNWGANDTPIGFVCRDTTTSDTEVEVALLDDFEWSLPVTHATAASAITAASQVGSQFEIESATGNIPAVAIDDTINKKVVVMGIDSRYPVGTQYARVWVKFITAKRLPEVGV